EGMMQRVLGISEPVSATAPIVLLILSGVAIRRLGLLTDRGVEEIKTLIVRVALPAVLFVAFLSLEFDSRYRGLFVLLPVLLVLLLAVGHGLSRLFSPSGPVPFLMTGFEFGMLGIGLFTTAYGMDRVGVIAVLGLPHEIFIWFVFVTLLRMRYGNGDSLAATARSFVTSPVIVAIVAGATLNIIGVGPWFVTSVVPAGFVRALEMLGGLVGPLVLIVIGYGTRIAWKSVSHALPLVITRFVTVSAIGLFAAPPVIEGFLGLERIFTHAVFTFLILPPPFIVPLYIPSDRREEVTYVNGVLSLYTVVSIAAFVIYVALQRG
ncbi:MAG: hypothetical protein MI724_17405, partial [Spirochaetales bacterium]|nr:hypothetical protein [Spirochaetales bacterium]